MSENNSSRWNVFVKCRYNEGGTNKAPYIDFSVIIDGVITYDDYLTIEGLVEVVGYDGLASSVIDLINVHLSEEGYESINDDFIEKDIISVARDTHGKLCHKFRLNKKDNEYYLETAEGNIGEEPQIVTTSTPKGISPIYEGYIRQRQSYYYEMNKPLEVKFIQADEKAKLPYMAHEDDACSDVHSVDNVDILPGETKAVDTGLKVAFIPKGHKVVVYCRSGFGFKSILVANAPGQIDEGYRGNLKILIHNASQKVVEVRPGDRIAQIALEKVIPVTYAWTETFEDTTRGVGGFGSSGIKQMLL